MTVSFKHPGGAEAADKGGFRGAGDDRPRCLRGSQARPKARHRRGGRGGCHVLSWASGLAYCCSAMRRSGKVGVDAFSSSVFPACIGHPHTSSTRDIMKKCSDLDPVGEVTFLSCFNNNPPSLAESFARIRNVKSSWKCGVYNRLLLLHDACLPFRKARARVADMLRCTQRDN